MFFSRDFLDQIWRLTWFKILKCSRTSNPIIFEQISCDFNNFLIWAWKICFLVCSCLRNPKDFVNLWNWYFKIQRFSNILVCQITQILDFVKEDSLVNILFFVKPNYMFMATDCWWIWTHTACQANVFAGITWYVLFWIFNTKGQCGSGWNNIHLGEK